MQELTDPLPEAAAAIEPGYFRLSIHGGLPVYRERVYCNELYHQMRKRWPGLSPFLLNGEGRQGGPSVLMELGPDGCKPDLLVHRPATWMAITRCWR
ncbi:hypothetical protein [Bradyrhizobium brasilense]|uniref:Uncharacterized protein n=1 Tax=Bradyrhizobium brasilense TaxID=1419277 RepID=A0ABY8JC92_9BRAD|nr:hypothetical protein [Bradyrhizobium brasilense]WFU62738.1 hypothetical protein QA636_35725 [Bradyrhizobium brasilense]